MAAIPTLSGYTSAVNHGSSATFSIDPADNLVTGGVAVGDWIIAVFMSAAASGTTKVPTAPGDWTTIVPQATVGSGTMCFGVWAHQYVTGDTTYTWNQTTTEVVNTIHRLIFVRGAANIADWVLGSFDYRENTGTTTTSVASSVTTTGSNSLALLIAGERTVAAETTGQVTCNNFTKQFFENDVDQSIFVATKDMAVAGSTNSSTVTYPNTHSFNGIAGILGIPSPGMTGVAWVI